MLQGTFKIQVISLCHLHNTILVLLCNGYLYVLSVCLIIELPILLFYWGLLSCDTWRISDVIGADARVIADLTSLGERGNLKFLPHGRSTNHYNLQQLLYAYRNKRADDTYLPTGQIISPRPFCTLPKVSFGPWFALGDPKIESDDPSNLTLARIK